MVTIAKPSTVVHYCTYTVLIIMGDMVLYILVKNIAFKAQP